MPAATPPAPRWQVESQLPSTEVGGDGKPQAGMRVNFVTAKGVHAYVFVPWTEYGPEAVRAKIAARVDMLDAVHSLNG